MKLLSLILIIVVCAVASCCWCYVKGIEDAERAYRYKPVEVREDMPIANRIIELKVMCGLNGEPYLWSTDTIAINQLQKQEEEDTFNQYAARYFTASWQAQYEGIEK